MFSPPKFCVCTYIHINLVLHTEKVNLNMMFSNLQLKLNTLWTFNKLNFLHIMMTTEPLLHKWTTTYVTSLTEVNDGQLIQQCIGLVM